MGFCLKTGMV